METRNSSKILTTPESIVREHRNCVIPAPVGIQKSSSINDRIIKTFFWLVLGWAIGYLHHYMTNWPH